MSFVQLWPQFSSRSLSPGLAAPLADPLWMVARQWQLGELAGEDAASPVLVTWKMQSVSVDTIAVNDSGKAMPSAPLETVVERENAWKSAGSPRLSLEIGALLFRALEEIGATREREVLRQHPALQPKLSGADPASLPLLTILAKRGIDGYTFYSALTTTTALSTEFRNLLKTTSSAVQTVVKTWIQTVSTLVETEESGAWKADRQEYAFRVATRAPEGDVVLEASEYTGGRLDWESFECVTPPATSLRGTRSASKVESQEATVGPSPVRYRGMPASRWWEFEDGAVHFGGLEAEPDDVVRLVLAEFATTFGDDWFVLPARLPVGALSRVASLSVVDSFGQRRTIEPMAARDQKIAVNRSWRFFELTGDPAAAAGRCPWLFLPTTIGQRQEGEAVEEVVFVRDEAANLGWAIEARLERADGRGRPHPPLNQSTQTREGWTFTPAPALPPGWIPLVPRACSNGDIELRRGRLAGSTTGAQARLLDPENPLTFKEEAVPAGGMVVTRSWQRCRGSDGRIYLWLGREKKPGRGEQRRETTMDRLQRA